MLQNATNGNCQAYGDVATVGNVLAQNLANTDMLLMRLGTNDQYVSIGTLGDATNSGTLYGTMRWVVETMLSAKPSLRIVLITPKLNQFASITAIQSVVDAEIAYGNSVGSRFSIFIERAEITPSRTRCTPTMGHIPPTGRSSMSMDRRLHNSFYGGSKPSD